MNALDCFIGMYFVVDGKTCVVTKYEVLPVGILKLYFQPTKLERVHEGRSTTLRKELIHALRRVAEDAGSRGSPLLRERRTREGADRCLRCGRVQAPDGGPMGHAKARSLKAYFDLGGEMFIEEDKTILRMTERYTEECVERLNELRNQALRIATEHGFKDATVGEDMALIHSEVSEALEAYREGSEVNAVWYEHKAFGGDTGTLKTDKKETKSLNGDVILNKPCGIPSEMADVIIRVLHFCGKHEIDIGKAVVEKMAFNESRPIKHGGKKL